MKIVLKFGGSSLGTPERVRNVISIIRERQAETSEPLMVVCSAFGGVTDQLIQLSTQAVAGDSAYKDELLQLESRHLEAVRALVGVGRQTAVIARVKFTLNELEDILHGCCLIRECTARTLDFVMSFGERLSAYIVAEALADSGVRAEFLDARQVIRTDDFFGFARVDFEATETLINDYITEHPFMQVMTGFIASSSSGETTTLGRSGSDYTAAILAGALRAGSLEIWTDVDGMLTADPRLVRRAFTMPSMSYEEAMELSHFGAKVIFPATMRPAMNHQIPIWIKNTFNPAAKGTVIRGYDTDARPIKGISSMGGITLMNIQGSGLLGVVGVSMRLFTTLARENVNVVLISQASSEHSICVAISSADAQRARLSLEKEFSLEISDGRIDEVHCTDKMAIIAVVGDGMKHQSGSSGRMFSALGKNGINVVAIAQGSSERNISAVINQHDVSKALNALHEAYFLSDRKVLNLYLLGTGLIGGTLIRQIREQREKLESDNHIELRLVGLGNSRKMIFDPEGLDLNLLPGLVNDQGDSMNLQIFRERILAYNLPNSILVDCTASEVVAMLYGDLLEASVSVVTPNKKANSGPYPQYRRLRDASRKRGTNFLFETNVGAGLPVINTLNDLLLSGDRVVRIEAVLSGTLNFIFSTFDGTNRMSAIIASAREKGFTEPDPRDDLSGTDVARKILILARESGYTLELSDIVVENLVPEDCRTGSVDEFLKQISKHDSAFEIRRTEAAAQGKKLRYMAVLENGSARVGLASVDETHPFSNLKGSDNIILLTTQRYLDRPMVIRGPGAGAEVTAAGVFADIIRLGNY